ncbi:MAG TPA: CoA ester lyase [Candidatus Methylomirabilis sp.]|nr:CoA ester lyase [Candidatus Methylomirabilis sp.]
MTRSPRPRRSVLFMPAANARAMDRARTLAADAIIFDLEGAVAPDAKAIARAQAVAALRAGGYGAREVVVRINGLATPWGREDVAAAAPTGADALLVPKVESAADVREVDEALAASGAPDSTAIWCMLETPRGVLGAAAIATATPRVGALVMGTSDLTKDLRARHTREREPLLTSLGLCVLAARAASVAALDGVHLDLEDDEGFARACRQAADMGFDGKTLIHPRQIAGANAAFAPTGADVAWARRVVAAHAEAQAEGRGVALLDGRLIENLHVEEARRIIALAGAITAMGG